MLPFVKMNCFQLSQLATVHKVYRVYKVSGCTRYTGCTGILGSVAALYVYTGSNLITTTMYGPYSLFSLAVCCQLKVIDLTLREQQLHGLERS